MAKLVLNGDVLRVQYVNVDTAKQWDENPKKHDLMAISQSIRKYGFRDPSIFDGTLGGIAAGNGRLQAVAMIREMGYEPPLGIATDEVGNWYVPMIFGIDAPSKAMAEAFAIDHNNLTLAGSHTVEDMLHLWNRDAIADILVRLRAEGEVEPVTVSSENLDRFLHEISLLNEPVPSLDDLEDEYGEPQEDDFWPEIRLKVAPDVKERFDRAFAQVDGDSDNEKVLSLLDMLE